MLEAARDAWDETLDIGKAHGYRNGQATVLAPTGTIGFMMDCDTTGIEPDIALIKYKRLVGGGMIKIVNNTVPEALDQLGYDETQVKAILDYIDTRRRSKGRPASSRSTCRSSIAPSGRRTATRSIHYMGHIRMMAAAQPFISGAISKTVNLPPEATVEDIEEAYLESWKLGPQGGRGLSRRLQAHAAALDQQDRARAWSRAADGPRWPPSRSRTGRRRRCAGSCPTSGSRFTHKFSIAGHEGYIHVGLYEDGEPGEIFVQDGQGGLDHLGPDGQLRHGDLAGAAARRAAAAPVRQVRAHPLRALRVHREPGDSARQLDHGLPLPLAGREVRARDAGGRGRAGRRAASAEIQRVGEVVAAAQKVEVIDVSAQERQGTAHNGHANGNGSTHTGNGNYSFIARTDAPTCPECGSIMIPNGSCHKCVNCGTTSGCS